MGGYAAVGAAGLLLATAVSKGLRRRRSIALNGRIALVTGGSRGLGLLVASELGREGMKIVLAARDAASLDRAREMLLAEGTEVSTLVADLSKKDDAERIVADTIRRHGALDLLVNNAGTIKVGPVEHMTVADFDEAMAVHFWGPLHTIRAAVPQMRAQGGGRIVNISSIGGRVGVPHLVPYCASKFALTGLSTSMAAELAASGIAVTTVCPGLMRTGSFFNAWFKGQHRREFAWFAIADSAPVLSIDGRRAAAQVVDAARHGDAELVISWPARLAILASAALPRTMAAAMAFSNRLLPSPAESRQTASWRGWQSTSRWAPSVLTRLSERPAAENNQRPPPVIAADAR